MIRKIDDGPWVDGARFIENWNKLPPAELLKYAGEHVAVLADGTRIVAHHPEMLELMRIVQAAGFGAAEVVISYVDSVDEIA